MDRDNRWDRVEKAYDLLTLAQGEFQADTAVAGLQAAYARDENDEFVKATVIRAEGQPDAAMEDGDALIFMNFRADRAREITRAFVNADFDGFARKKVVNVDFVMLTEYAADIKTAVAYPPASTWLTPSASGWRKTTKLSCVFPKPKNMPTLLSSSTVA